jgi:hypothetical protein
MLSFIHFNGIFFFLLLSSNNFLYILKTNLCQQHDSKNIFSQPALVHHACSPSILEA